MVRLERDQARQVGQLTTARETGNRFSAYPERGRRTARGETMAGLQHPRRGFTSRVIHQLRWFAWTLSALVVLCLLLAAWVWGQILQAGL